MLITGGTGFIGSNLTLHLTNMGANVIVASRGKKEPTIEEKCRTIHVDLTRLEDCRLAAKDVDYVFHLASAGYGLAWNAKHPAQTLAPNLLMNTNMLQAARLEGVQRFLFVSSSSVYPANLSTLEEDKAWDGNPHPSDSFFAWSKRMGELTSKAYSDEYGLKTAIVRLGNPYGIYDNFDIETSHVIPALIKRALSLENPFTVWGTGDPVRNFIYVSDVVEGMLLALEKYAVADPLNIASSESVKIKDLVSLVLRLTDYKGSLFFDTSKPDGHPYKFLSAKKAEEKIGFRSKVSLEEGLKKTIKWYKENGV